jgi:hypothetical protein
MFVRLNLNYLNWSMLLVKSIAVQQPLSFKSFGRAHPKLGAQPHTTCRLPSAKANRISGYAPLKSGKKAD